MKNRKNTITPNMEMMAVLGVAFGITLVAMLLSDNDWRFPALAVICVFALYAAYRFIDFEPDQICIRYLFDIKRRISRERITSIEFVMDRWQGGYLLIALDGFIPYREYDKGLKRYRNKLTTKLIAVPIPDKKRSEYVKIVTAHYPNVFFIDWDAE